MLSSLSSPTRCLCRRNVLHAGGPSPSPSPPPPLHTRLSVCGRLAARVCEALPYWVVMENGQVFSLPDDIESTVASRFKQVRGQVLLGRWNAALLPCNTMEERPYGSSAVRSWTGSVGLGFILIRRSRCQTNKAQWM